MTSCAATGWPSAGPFLLYVCAYWREQPILDGTRASPPVIPFR